MRPSKCSSCGRMRDSLQRDHVHAQGVPFVAAEDLRDVALREGARGDRARKRSERSRKPQDAVEHHDDMWEIDQTRLITSDSSVDEVVQLGTLNVFLKAHTREVSRPRDLCPNTTARHHPGTFGGHVTLKGRRHGVRRRSPSNQTGAT